MKTEVGSWGMESLWQRNAAKCVMGIVDTVFVHDRKPVQWYFTCKTGEVLRKKKLSEVPERFVRIALANDRNIHGHVCLARRTNGAAYLWDQATFLRALESHFDGATDVIALQPFVCSRGSLGAIYRHELKTTGDRTRTVFATSKVAQHQVASSDPVVSLDPVAPGIKSQAKTINNRLNQLSLGLAKHIEEIHGCRVKEMVTDYIVDDDDQIWLAWVPSVSIVRLARQTNDAEPVEPQEVHGRSGEEALFDEAEVALDGGAHFSLKPHGGELPRAFPTPFKCSGDFCTFELEAPTPLQRDATAAPAPARRNAHALFAPEDIQALGPARLLELTTASVRQLANAANDRLEFTLTYRSIALAKGNKQRLVAVEAPPATKKHSYLEPTASATMRAHLNKLYGELDGGTANYYRQVKVCRNCFAVYSMLDAARPLLEAMAASNNVADADDMARPAGVRAKAEIPVSKLPRLASPEAASPSGTARLSADVSLRAEGSLSSSASMPQLGLPRLPPSPTKPYPWRKSKDQPEVTKSFDDYVGLDGYLRGKTRRRKNKTLVENSLFPGGLPLKEKAPPATDDAPSVLLVEADQAVIRLVLDALNDAYDVEAVCDGALALKCAQERRYDVVLCSRDAPSMGAIEFTKILRQHEIQLSIARHEPVRRSPVVCVTEHTSPEDLRVYMEVGMDGCLARPLDPAALQQTLAAALAARDKAPPPRPSLHAMVAQAKSSVRPEAVPRRKPRRGRDLSAVHAFPTTTQTDERRFAGVFQMDVDTAIPFVVLNRPPAKPSTLFSLVFVHDVFDTLERLQILLAPLAARYPGAQILLWNYPGQAFTTWRKGVLLNNAYLATCLDALLRHVGPDGLNEFKKMPFVLVGYGNGGNIALQYAAALAAPVLRAVVAINGFAYIDTTLAAFFHDAMKVFACSPATRPDLPVYFHARFLFSGAYLATVSTPLALNLYTAVSNPISLEGRVALCLGALSHADLRPAVARINVPTVLVASAQDGLVQPLHVDALVAARGGVVDSIHRALAHRKKTCVVWLDAGHEVFQECKPTMTTLLEQLLTGFHETHEVAVPQGAPAPPLVTPPGAHAPLSYEDHFINKVMGTMSAVKLAHDAGDASWAAFQADRQLLAAKPRAKPGAAKAALDAIYDPMAPAFERETNRVYRAGEGSRIYPNPAERADVKEYMNWRVQRNATRLTRMHRAARQIQRGYHAYRARTLARRMARHKAALCIQRIYRGAKGREKAAARRKEDWAVRLVQRAWRGKVGRDAFALARAQRAAAVAIQAVARGFLARTRVTKLRARRFRAACMIQALFRRLYAIKIAQRKRLERRSAIAIQRVYRGHLGRKRHAAERDKYLYSKAQTQNIDFGKQMLLEYKLYGTRLQSEVQLLVDEKVKTEASVEALLKEISEFEEGVHVLETEMHALSKIETEATGVLDEHAKWQLREQKMRLDREFGTMLKKIADRREKLVVLGTTLHQLDQARHAKEEDLRGLERKLLLLLEDQQRQLQGIKAKQAKRSQVLVDIAGGVTEPGPLGTDVGGPTAAAAASAVSPEQRQEANALMESTETMMKFGFMSMSMTYFSSMNMIKAMRQIGAHHTFLESAAAIHAHAGAPTPFQADPPPGSFPGQQPLLVSAWSVNDVGRWLDTMALGTYKQAFSDGSVDGALLYDLNDHDLRYSLGIEHDLHRKKILQAVDRLKVAEGITKDRLYPKAAPAPTDVPATQAFVPASVPKPTGPPEAAAASAALPKADPDLPKLAVKFEELCSFARNGKLKALKEALERWPDVPFDKLGVKAQYTEGVGTVYEDALERLAFHMNKGDDHGNTLLMLAAQNNLLKVAQFLVSKGANPNHQNKQGQTAGHYAMAYNFFDLGAWLLDPDKGGGRDDLPNINGLTAYDGLG
ncbi:hypothetical protein ACHHYP_06976 [Achlya hypogyna]|uniref:Uncharacterized protein n=1 Tax=Achlya hypogyna TaxID=1202772 RepID=A0A1V9YRD8_ACHHY|nr:hypothetical protein ACHHYP_06976 [Achlya hypogyna]